MPTPGDSVQYQDLAEPPQAPFINPPPVPSVTAWMPSTPVLVRGRAVVRASGLTPSVVNPSS